MQFKRWIPMVYLTIFCTVLWCVVSSQTAEDASDSCLLEDALTPPQADVINPETLKEYIVQVINHGSNQLNYPAGAMESGYVSPKDAPKVADYVLYLMGHRPMTPEMQEGNLLYNGNCGGCHGDEGGGLNGAFPRLDRKKLQGFPIP